MVATETKVCNFGWQAVDFDLPGVDGKRYSLASARGPNGLLVMFICNHCPYVKAVLDRIVRDCSELATQGIGSIAIMSNDPAEYPEDSFDNMARLAREKRFGFPYVHDETQAAMYLLDEAGAIRVGAAQYAHGGGGFALHGDESKGAAVLYMKDRKGTLTFYDDGGGVRARLPE